MKKILFTISILGMINCYAQEKVQYQDCDEIIEEANQLGGNNSYHEAYEKMTEINENDSCYIRSLVNRTYFLLNDEELEDDFKCNEVIRLTQMGIESDRAINKYLHHFNQIAAYLNLKQYDDAMVAIDKALVAYPAKSELYNKKGEVYEHQEKYSLAAESFKESLLYDPFNRQAHLKLGLLCYKSEKITQALMCFNIYLTLSPDGENAVGSLNFINEAVSKQYDGELIDVVISKDDAAFEEIDLLIKNQIALQKKYKVKNKLGELPIVKQNHLMLDQLKSFEGNEGFFEKKYIPFFSRINETNKFDIFCYTICFSAKNPKYQKIVLSKQKEVTAFTVQCYNQLADLNFENEILVDGARKKVNCEYTYSGLSGIGKVENDKAVGQWTFFDSEHGFRKSEGPFDSNGDREGDWTWYYQTGAIETEVSYIKGKIDGVYKQYFPSGQLNYDVEYVAGEVQGLYHRYNKFGALVEEKSFEKSKIDGVNKEYFEIGDKFQSYNIDYVNGEVEGKVIEYFSNGQQKLDLNFTNGKRNGIEKKYYSNGQLLSEVNYVDNFFDGDAIEYYPDGKKYREGKWKAGLNEGLWTYYYHNGEVDTKRSFLNGNLDGDYIKYDLDGKIQYKHVYKKGNLMEVFSYDKEGKEFYSDKKKKGELFFKAYSPYGILLAEGLYDLDGGKEEAWDYYNDNGVLTSTENYTKGSQNGSSITYYPDGSEETFSTFKDDTLTGYYYEKFENGNLSFQGWYKSGKKHGTFLSYFPSGKLSTSNFFVNGVLNGEQKDFGLDGKITSSIFYHMGNIESTVYYDKEGEVLKKHLRSREKDHDEDYFFANGEKRLTHHFTYGIFNGAFTSYFPGGKKRAEGTYLNGERNGKWKWYFENGQLETETEYILGEINGVRKEYHKNGQLSDESFYILGVMHGENKDYNDEGVLTSVSTKEFGVNHGKRYFYCEQGELQLIRFYNNDVLIGYSYLGTDGKELPMIPIENETANIIGYFENGKISREMNIVKGLFQGEYNAYYSNGQLEANTKYKNDEVNGVVTEYYSDGKLKSEKEYLNGKLHGDLKNYYANGQLKYQGSYVYGNSQGDFIKYSKDGKVLSNRVYDNDNFIGNNKL